MKNLESASVYFGSKFNKLAIIPAFPSSKPFYLNGGKSNPIISIYSSELLHSSANIEGIFSNQHQVFKFEIDEEQLSNDNEESQVNIYTYQMIAEAREQNLISCFGDSSNYYIATNKGQIHYMNHQKEEQIWIKINDNSNSFGNTAPTHKKQYKKCIASKNCDKFAFIGKDLLPFVFDRDQGMISWKGKNVRNDYLDLQVPIDDIDAKFFKQHICLAVANANKKIRLYDVRSRTKKPISDNQLKLIPQKSNLTKLAISSDQNYLFVGNGQGGVYELDMRKNCAIVSKFKGSNTTIQGLQITDQLLISCSLDGYMRIFDRNDRKLIKKTYLNISPTCMALPYDFNEKYKWSIQKQRQKQEEEEKQNEQKQVRKRPKRNRERNIEAQNAQEQVKKTKKKIKDIRTRNKIGLWYLKSENIGEFPEVKLQNIKLQVKKEQIQEQNESSSLL